VPSGPRGAVGATSVQYGAAVVSTGAIIKAQEVHHAGTIGADQQDRLRWPSDV